MLCEMQSVSSGIELVSPCPFPTTITITPRAPPFFRDRLEYTDCIPCRRISIPPQNSGILDITLNCGRSPILNQYTWRIKKYPAEYSQLMIILFAQLAEDCKIYRLLLCSRVRPPPTSVLNMTLNNLMVRFQ